MLPREPSQRREAYSDFNGAMKRSSLSRGIGELSPIVWGCSKIRGLTGVPFIEHRVLAKRTETGRNDRASLSRVQEDVSGRLGRAIKPVRVVKCSTVDAKYLGKSFQGPETALYRSSSRN